MLVGAECGDECLKKPGLASFESTRLRDSACASVHGLPESRPRRSPRKLWSGPKLFQAATFLLGLLLVRIRCRTSSWHCASASLLSPHTAAGIFFSTSTVRARGRIGTKDTLCFVMLLDKDKARLIASLSFDAFSTSHTRL